MIAHNCIQQRIKASQSGSRSTDAYNSINNRQCTSTFLSKDGYDKNISNEKVLAETQTLRAGRSKAEPKFFCPIADPLPGGARRPKFNHLQMVTTFTYKPSL